MDKFDYAIGMKTGVWVDHAQPEALDDCALFLVKTRPRHAQFGEYVQAVLPEGPLTRRLYVANLALWTLSQVPVTLDRYDGTTETFTYDFSETAHPVLEMVGKKMYARKGLMGVKMVSLNK